jgi:hypothetical protein
MKRSPSIVVPRIERVAINILDQELDRFSTPDDESALWRAIRLKKASHFFGIGICAYQGR